MAPPTDATKPEQASPRNPPLSEVSLEDLRRLRRRLQQTEERLSYWRRLVHARIDLLDAGGSTDPSSSDSVMRILARGIDSTERTFLASISADYGRPPSIMEAAWNNTRNASGAQAEEVRAGLEAAEQELSALRSRVIHEVDAASAELVRRYRGDLRLATSALPPSEPGAHQRR